MLYIKGILLTVSGLVYSDATCPRPAFSGDQASTMSPTQLLKRAARRAGGVPTQAEVYASDNVKRIQRVLSDAQFNALFPRANGGLGPDASNGPYSYFNFLKAAAMWPSFCNEAASSSVDLDILCKKEMASMFAHFAQEVGEHDVHSVYPTWQQGLYHYTEMGCSDNPSTSGCEYRGGTCEVTTWMGQTWPCPTGVKYYGRGAKQLSYNFNYGPFSYALFGDVNVLLKDPSLVVAKDETNGWMALASAFWFYMTPQSPKPSMHDQVAGFWVPNAADIAAGRVTGFGVLIMIINGGIECGGSVEVAQAANRITYYQAFLDVLGLPAEDPATMTCTNMKQFDASSSAFVPSYWEQGWSSQPCGSSCQLVSYQTGFSIFDDPTSPDTPYNKCLNYYFGPTTTADPSIITTSVDPSITSTAPIASTCNTCSTCVAVPGNSQAATDSMCSPCAMDGQSWWPCNVGGLCQCGSSGSTTTKAPVTTTVSATTTQASATTTQAPVTTTKAPVTTTKAPVTTTKAPVTTTHASTTTVSTVAPIAFPCTACDACVAVPGNPQAASDSMCSPCAHNGQAWWPCNIGGLCQCAMGSPVTTVAPVTTAVTTAAPTSTASTSCSTCATCVAIPGNYQAATDSMCAPCGNGTLQQWWPCKELNTCTCK